MTTKYCTKCKTTKSVEEFQVLSSSKDGRHSYCCLCINEYRRLGGHNKRPRPVDYHKKRRGWEAHRKTIRGRAYVLWKGACNRASAMNLPCTLTLDWVIENLEPMICQATGSPLSFDIPATQRMGRWSPSIDQILPRAGYTPDNCRVVCMIYNQAKNQGTHDDVVMMAKALLNKEK